MGCAGLASSGMKARESVESTVLIFKVSAMLIYEKYLNLLHAKGVVYEDEGAVRFRSPRKSVIVDDLVCGRIEFDRSMDPDMTIRRPDGSWIFHFVNVVDDIEMKISHVIRGEDHLTNTAKHVELYEALGATPPSFAHIPLILNRDGSKMSKRDAGASVASYVEQGYAPEAVRNYLCLLGWSPKDNREKIEIEEVIQLFDLTKVNRRNAAFDLDKCYWLNGQYVLHMSLGRFRELSEPFIQKAGITISRRSVSPEGIGDRERKDETLQRCSGLDRILFYGGISV